MRADSQVLVAILKDEPAFRRLRDEHWYHIPVDMVDKWVKGRWPPECMAFYQTKCFGNEAHAVKHYSQVREIRRVPRGMILPDQPHKAHLSYYQIMVDPLKVLPQPIRSRRKRHITFIPTTWEKLTIAEEINDLSDESPLEDLLWAELKRLHISAERQEFVKAEGEYYALDFTIYCMAGKLDVETDGDRWHANPEGSRADNLRDNYLQSRGWHILRFTTTQLQNEMSSCVRRIAESIRNRGGVDEDRVRPREIHLENPQIRQLDLFDD